ncbi:MAG: DUF3427 domain-containing protein [Capsulimonadales bacterium]|nr:DUF3427 domain-containing protein [Capsulimonadales bacterium]
MGQMFFPFTVGKLYKRKDIYSVIGIPEDTKGGNWDTGYNRFGNDWFIFCNIGTPGRTGHDYDNQWLGTDLLWFGKNGTTVNQPTIKLLVDGQRQVYIFVRSDQRSPFVFVGCGIARTVFDTKPVSVVWELFEPDQGSVSIQTHSFMFKEARELNRYVVESKPETIDLLNIQDARRRRKIEVVQRQGQHGFRYTLLSAYRGRCSFSGTEVPEALEAAHIIPYRGPKTNDPTNGLLLRADIHTLFDLGRLAVDVNSMSVLLCPSLKDTEYGIMAGRKISVPEKKGLRPDAEALNEHRKLSRL